MYRYLYKYLSGVAEWKFLTRNKFRQSFSRPHSHRLPVAATPGRQSRHSMCLHGHPRDRCGAPHRRRHHHHQVWSIHDSRRSTPTWFPSTPGGRRGSSRRTPTWPSRPQWPDRRHPSPECAVDASRSRPDQACMLSLLSCRSIEWSTTSSAWMMTASIMIDWMGTPRTRLGTSLGRRAGSRWLPCLLRCCSEQPERTRWQQQQQLAHHTAHSRSRTDVPSVAGRLQHAVRFDADSRCHLVDRAAHP